MGGDESNGVSVVVTKKHDMFVNHVVDEDNCCKKYVKEHAKLLVTNDNRDVNFLAHAREGNTTKILLFFFTFNLLFSFPVRNLICLSFFFCRRFPGQNRHSTVYQFFKTINTFARVCFPSTVWVLDEQRNTVI